MKIKRRYAVQRQKGMRNKITKTVIGILILVTGIAIFLYPDYREWRNQREIQQIAEPLFTEEGDDRKLQRKENAEVGSEAQVGDKEISTSGSLDFLKALQEYNTHLYLEGQDITDAWNFRQTPVNIKELNHGSSVVGHIELPDISVSLPLAIGATESNMSSGAVVLTETSMPVGGRNTNCVIAAHRGWKGSAYFRDIDQLKIGSKIHIRNLWEKLTYQVTGTEIIHASECDILNIQEGKDMVTLFSCYPYMSPGTEYRLVIYCEREVKGNTEKTVTKKFKEQGVTVKKLAEKELAGKGIVLENRFTETLAEKEDLLRVFLPVICIFVTVLIIILRLKKKR